jgi:hypothetical protein
LEEILEIADDSSRNYVKKTGADGKVTWVVDREQPDMATSAYASVSAGQSLTPSTLSKPAPMVQPAGEVGSTYPTQVVSRHRAAEVTCAHPVKMTTAQSATDIASTAAAATCKRIGRNASASHRHGGNDDRGSVQHKFLHGSFLSR